MPNPSEFDPPDISDDIDVGRFPIDHPHAKEIHAKIRSLPEADELLSRQLTIIGKIDPISALKRLTIADMVNAIITNVDIPDDGAGLPPSQHRYLIGLVYAHGNLTNSAEISYRDLAGPIMDLCLREIHDEDIDPTDPEEKKLEHAIKHSIKEQVFIAGEWMYSEQPIEGSKRAYEPHDDYLVDKLGFTIGEAHACASFLEEIFAERRKRIVGFEFVSLVEEISKGGHSLHALQRQREEKGSVDTTSNGEDFRRDAELLERLYQLFGYDERAFSIKKDYILSRCPRHIEPSILESFLDRFSDTVGAESTNPDFQWPFQFNPIFSTPLLEVNDRYYSPNGDALRLSLLKSPYYDLINIEGYGNPQGNHGGEFGRIFGKYLEEWTVDCLSKIYPSENIFYNPLHPDTLEEACDLLIISNDTAFVYECKTGKLPLSIRTQDFETIQDELHSKIGEAFTDQALPLINEFRNGEIDEIISEGDVVGIDVTDYQPVVVIGEQYDSVTTHLIDVLFEDDDLLPYVVDIFAFQVITEFFDSCAEFEAYIRNRVNLLENRSIVSGDEVDYLGLYYLNDFEFPESGDFGFIYVEDMGYVIGEEIDFKFGS